MLSGVNSQGIVERHGRVIDEIQEILRRGSAVNPVRPVTSSVVTVALDDDAESVHWINFFLGALEAVELMCWRLTTYIH